MLYAGWYNIEKWKPSMIYAFTTQISNLVDRQIIFQKKNVVASF